MITLTLDPTSEAPTYRQIADQLRVLIAEGRLTSGAVLPGVRDLGNRLGVNQNTVARAYRTLAEEGLVDLTQGRPARVGDPAGAALEEPKAGRLAALLSEWVLAGADRSRIEAAVGEALDRFFDIDGRSAALLSRGSAKEAT